MWQYPEEISINLAPGLCWTIVTETNTDDIFSPTNEKEVVLLLDNSTLPETGEKMQAEVDEQQMEELLTVNGSTTRQHADELISTGNPQALESTATDPALARQQHAPSQPANTSFLSNPTSEIRPKNPESSASSCLPSGDSKIVSEPK